MSPEFGFDNGLHFRKYNL